MKVEDLKVGGYYNLKKMSFILVKVKQYNNTAINGYHLYWTRHPEKQGQTSIYWPEEFKNFLSRWS